MSTLSPNRQQFLASLIPTWSRPETNLGIFTEGNLLLSFISNLPLGLTNEGQEAINLISGSVAGDSILQDRGVAHYLLSFLFSLVVYLSVFTFVSLIKI